MISSPRTRATYLAALAERHRWLKLIGVSHRMGVHRPRLQEVYISLRLASDGAADSPRFDWNEVFKLEERRLSATELHSQRPRGLSKARGRSL